MSALGDARRALAAAASTVAGVTGRPHLTSETEPGTAWVRLTRLEYPNRFGPVAHLAVVLVLPQDPAETETYLDQKIGPMTAALAGELVITSIVPTQLIIDGIGTLPTAFFNGHREA